MPDIENSKIIDLDVVFYDFEGGFECEPEIALTNLDLILLDPRTLLGRVALLRSLRGPKFEDSLGSRFKDKEIFSNSEIADTMKMIIEKGVFGAFKDLPEDTRNRRFEELTSEPRALVQLFCEMLPAELQVPRQVQEYRDEYMKP